MRSLTQPLHKFRLSETHCKDVYGFEWGFVGTADSNPMCKTRKRVLILFEILRRGRYGEKLESSDLKY